LWQAIDALDGRITILEELMSEIGDKVTAIYNIMVSGVKTDKDDEIDDILAAVNSLSSSSGKVINVYSSGVKSKVTGSTSVGWVEDDKL
jgi:hypothetical protein